LNQVAHGDTEASTSRKIPFRERANPEKPDSRGFWANVYRFQEKTSTDRERNLHPLAKIRHTILCKTHSFW
jgi:hypothetical protein